MKRTFFSVLMMTLSLYVYGADKMSMVTYFPVPYVAYSRVNVGKQLDVGLHNACELNLGCAESGVSLQAAHTDLLKGNLSLNGVSYVKGSTMELGSGVGASDVTFGKNLRIGTLNDGLSLETTRMTLSDLILFPGYTSNGSSFPACTGAEGAPEISWQKLKLKDKEEVYLVCGKTAQSTPPSDTCDKTVQNAACCEKDASYFTAQLKYCCGQVEALYDQRCVYWEIVEEVNPENGGSHNCMGGLRYGNWSSTNSKTSVCEGYRNADAYEVCPMETNPGNMAVLCNDSVENLCSNGELAFMENVTWYCQGAWLY